MTAKVATRRSVTKLGPDGATRFDVATSAGLAAWEAMWAEHLGQQAPDPIEVERHGGSGGGEADPVAKARHAEALAYVRDYTGRWGLPLDIRARDSWGTKYLRLSPAQVEALLKGKARDEAWAAERVAKAPTIAAPRVEVTEGWYVLADVVYKVQRNLSGTGLYAKRLDLSGSALSGRGTWEYVPGAIRLLAEARPLTVEEAAAFGKLYGFCVVCGRRLTDEVSIEAGIGPVCKGRLEA